MPNSDDVVINTESLADLAVFTWRLDAWLTQQENLPSPTVPRYVIRGLKKVLDNCCVTALDVTGHVFDAGLACDVVDTIEVDSLPPGDTVIAETISPIVSINGQLVRQGQIVLHVGKES